VKGKKPGTPLETTTLITTDANALVRLKKNGNPFRDSRLNLPLCATRRRVAA
jgi:hypothetical protein